MIAQQVGGKATRDALFLSAFGAARLPDVMLASAFLSVGGVLAMSGAMARLGPARLIPALFSLSAAGYFGEWLLSATHPSAAALLVYLHVAVLGSLLISGFWSVVSERFDPHTAKKVIGRIASGATSGGLLGGVIAERVASTLSSRAMLLFLAGMCLLCAIALVAVGKGEGEPVKPASAMSGLRTMRETPYLLLLGVLVTLTAFTGGIVDYVFKTEADATFNSSETLMSFFAIFYTVTSLLTIVLQTTVSKRALAKLGIGGTIALLPGAVALSSIAGAAVTRLWTLVVVCGMENVLYNSLYRSGYELLFTPLSSAKKRPTKTAIDVGFDRFGKALAGGVALVVVSVAAAHAVRITLVIVIAAALVTVIIASRLHRSYVQELAESLKAGRIKLREDDIFDATTKRTLAETTMAIDRARLLQEIEQLRKAQENDVEPATVRLSEGHAAELSGSHDELNFSAITVEDEATGSPPSQPPTYPLSELAEPVARLLSADRERVTAELRPPMDLRLASLVIPLLGHPEHALMARRALRSAAERMTGQLTDAMLDPETDATVRRRLPDVLKTCRTPRAVSGLLAGLQTDYGVVRERCGLALEALVASEPTLVPAEQDVLDVVKHECDNNPAPRLTHLFRLLGIIYEREAMRLAAQALAGDDPVLRGTSLEYLENVLPEATRLSLWPHLNPDDEELPPPSQRSTRELREHLERFLQKPEKL